MRCPTLDIKEPINREGCRRDAGGKLSKCADGGPQRFRAAPTSVHVSKNTLSPRLGEFAAREHFRCDGSALAPCSWSSSCPDMPVFHAELIGHCRSEVGLRVAAMTSHRDACRPSFENDACQDQATLVSWFCGASVLSLSLCILPTSVPLQHNSVLFGLRQLGCRLTQSKLSVSLPVRVWSGSSTHEVFDPRTMHVTSGTRT
jgi:hypothetical protein